MEHKRENPSASFTLPDKITVRQQLEYFSQSRASSLPIFERLWLSALPLISDWQCEIMPDKLTDLDKITDPTVTQVIMWAGVVVKGAIDALELVEKN